MVNTEDILKATGIKSARTLTRWHQQGLIPKPEIRTHPSGRGKMSYWPDTVLDRCVKLVQLRSEGHSLKAAQQMLGPTSILQTLLNKYANTPIYRALFNRENAELGVKLEDVFIGVVLAELKHLFPHPDTQDLFITKMAETNVLSKALRRLERGLNPILVFDGDRFHVTTDFLVAARLSEKKSPAGTQVVVPLLPLLKKFFSMVGQEIPDEVRVFPAQTVWEWSGGKSENRIERCYIYEGLDSTPVFCMGREKKFNE